MREIQTLTTHQIAVALAKREEGTGPNFAPTPSVVDRIADRLTGIAVDFGFTPEALHGEQPLLVQDRYVARAASGQYDTAVETPVYL